MSRAEQDWSRVGAGLSRAEQGWGRIEQDWSRAEQGCACWHRNRGTGGMTEGLNEGLKETSCKLWSRGAAV